MSSLIPDDMAMLAVRNSRKIFYVALADEVAIALKCNRMRINV